MTEKPSLAASIGLPKTGVRSANCRRFTEDRHSPTYQISARRMDVIEARWNGSVIARSDDMLIVEGNHYFPADSVDAGVLRPSSTTTICPWKGTALYYSLHVGGAENLDAAWYYPDPKAAAEKIRGRIAFWKGVTVG